MKHWHEQIGDPSLADSIMDRLIHNAYRIELDGEKTPIRKKKGAQTRSRDGRMSTAPLRLKHGPAGSPLAGNRSPPSVCYPTRRSSCLSGCACMLTADHGR